jgi:hypothetical protein
MGIKWLEFGQVFGAALVAAVLIVVLFSFGVIGLSRRAVARERGGTATGAMVGTVACFALCVAIVGFGVYLIVKP